MCLVVFVCGGCGLGLPGFYPTLMRGAANTENPIARSFGRFKEMMMMMMTTHTVRRCHLLTTKKPKQQTPQITSTKQPSATQKRKTHKTSG